MRTKLRGFLKALVKDSILMAEQAQRKTVSAIDVVQALKGQGAISLTE